MQQTHPYSPHQDAFQRRGSGVPCDVIPADAIMLIMESNLKLRERNERRIWPT